MNEPISRRTIEAVRREIFSALHCALPGTVESFDPETRTAEIRPAARPGNGTALPLLRDVPVFLPDTGAPRTISPGDGCLVVFSDLPADAWLEGDEDAPVPDRQHDLSDAFAFVGFRPKAAAQKKNGGDGHA